MYLYIHLYKFIMQTSHSPFTATPSSSPTKEGDRDSLCLSLTPDKDLTPQTDRISTIKNTLDIDKKSDIDIDRWAENRGIAAGLKGDAKEKVSGDLRNTVYFYIYLNIFILYVFMYIHIYIYVYIHISIYVCVYRYIQLYIYTYKYLKR
jgi:hypothetical protein